MSSVGQGQWTKKEILLDELLSQYSMFMGKKLNITDQ